MLIMYRHPSRFADLIISSYTQVSTVYQDCMFSFSMKNVVILDRHSMSVRKCLVPNHQTAATHVVATICNNDRQLCVANVGLHTTYENM